MENSIRNGLSGFTELVVRGALAEVGKNEYEIVA